MALTERINEDMKSAMREKDQVRLRALRAVKAALLLSQTEKSGSRELSGEEEIKLLQKLVKQRKDSLEIFEKQDRSDLAEKEKEEIEVIEKYLPQQMGDEELKAAISQIITETGASSAREMGKVIGIANQRLAGKAEGKRIASVAKDLLGGS